MSTGAKLPAIILCSSGTTGPPKPIAVSHASLIYQLQDTRSFGINRFFTFSGLNWGCGIGILLRSTFHNIARVLVNQPFNPSLALEIIRKHQIDYFVCTAEHVQLMMMEKDFHIDDFATLKLFHCVGSVVPKSLQDKVNIPMVSAYGFTEGGMVAANGKLYCGVSIKIINDDGNHLGIGETGEICVKPRFPFLGYFNNHSAAKDILMDDGFLHTGDIGYFDDHGVLHIIDRIKDIFKFNFKHVNPSDIEKELQLIPDISLVCVVGIPDEIFRNIPAAVIKRREGSTLTELEVHCYAKEKLKNWQWLRGGVYFVEEFPMTESGKIIRRDVLRGVINSRRVDMGFEY